LSANREYTQYPNIFTQPLIEASYIFWNIHIKNVIETEPSAHMNNAESRK